MEKKKWAELKNETMSRAEQEEAHREAVSMLNALPLAEIRKARELTQEQLASTLAIPQGSVSKIERRTDWYVSTLRRYIEAMGGTLHVVASFPGGDLEVESFQHAGELSPEAEPQRLMAAAG